jgi:hypothetical protein
VNTHTDSHTNHFLEKEDAAVDKLLIPPFKNVAQIMLPGSPVKKEGRKKEEEVRYSKII